MNTKTENGREHSGHCGTCYFKVINVSEIEFKNGSFIKVIESKNEIKRGKDLFEHWFDSNTKRLAELDRLATEIEITSGYSLEKLLELFLVGYTLEAPTQNVSLCTLSQERGNENE